MYCFIEDNFVDVQNSQSVVVFVTRRKLLPFAIQHAVTLGNATEFNSQCGNLPFRRLAKRSRREMRMNLDTSIHWCDIVPARRGVTGVRAGLWRHLGIITSPFVVLFPGMLGSCYQVVKPFDCLWRFVCLLIRTTWSTRVDWTLRWRNKRLRLTWRF